MFCCCRFLLAACQSGRLCVGMWVGGLIPRPSPVYSSLHFRPRVAVKSALCPHPGCRPDLGATVMSLVTTELRVRTVA